MFAKMSQDQNQDRFLFQFDGAPENRPFVERWKQRYGGEVYAGVSVTLGSRWTPDLAEVTVDAIANEVELRLIELEADDKQVRVSCRKYLPEPSQAIVTAFVEYLDDVLGRCRKTHDQRIDSFRRLKEFLCPSPTVIVKTAGALRNSLDFLEEFLLIDTHSGELPVVVAAKNPERRPFLCENEQNLSREQVEVLRRVVRVLHAVLIGNDHYDCSIDSAQRRMRSAIDNALISFDRPLSELQRLHSPESQRGAHVDCDKIVAELADLWTSRRPDATLSRVRSWVEGFYPFAQQPRKHEPVRLLIEPARIIVAGAESNAAGTVV
jgi:hypothetical protein